MKSTATDKTKQTSCPIRKFAAYARMSQVWWLALAATSIGLLVLLAGQQVRAIPMDSSSLAELDIQQTPKQRASVFDNLISEFLDDAGNLHKKSKMSSMRQIKQTLRFGRRSDPLMAPTFGERLELNGNANDHEQRRLFSLEE